jgi:peptide/nickel transport system permease protein
MSGNDAISEEVLIADLTDASGRPSEVDEVELGRDSGGHSEKTRRRRTGARLRDSLTGYTLAGAILVVIVVLVCLFAPLIAGHDPVQQDVKNRLAVPAFMQGGNWSHPLGTDGLGRDLWARIVFGLRTSLLISIPAVAIAAALGVLIGITAGYFGGVFGAALMRLTDVQMAFPFIILGVTLLSVYSPGPVTLIAVLSLSAWPVYARIIRSIALVDGHSEYVLAARSMGASHWRIITRYLLRNMVVSVLILSTLDVASVIILEALLSFLGLGIQPPGMSLGTVMSDGKDYLSNGVWWITTMPGVMILITLLGLNLLGDGLQSKFDPRLRRRS